MTQNQILYKQALRNLRQRIRRAKKKGYIIDDKKIIPAKPKRVTKASIERIKNIKPKTYAENRAEIEAEEHKRRSAAAKKAAETRRINKYKKAFEYVQDLIYNTPCLDYREIYKEECIRIWRDFEKGFDDSLRRQNKRDELVEYYIDYFEIHYDAIDKIIYKVYLDSKQTDESLQNYMEAYRVIFSFGEISSEAEKMELYKNNDTFEIPIEF